MQPPPPTPPGPSRWPWIVGALALVLVAVVVVGGLLGGSDSDSGQETTSAGSGDSEGSDGADDGCPTGRPSVRVASSTAAPMFTPLPGQEPPASSEYTLDVEFEVTNEASAPIVVETIEAGVVHHPEAVVAAVGDGEPIAPGEAAIVDGFAQVTVDGAGAAVPLAPDAGSIVLSASWADDDLFHCEI